ncbi:peptidase S8 [Streptomyces triticagri]|uniref:Peptidase S8 n=1 Tax=Streptomyces triticagri TaxID=2293568 RepID=A0A372LW68_9ACTN|nr:S8 family serine peptidase [Streptomyces triticagri]RFU82916.1 peptidase S8 [Streptomyces triticagri]
MAATAALVMTTGAAAPDTNGAADARAAGGKQQPAPQRVQLITGDVALVTDGRPTGFVPAAGRENIPVSVRTVGERQLVVPLDAQRLIADGRLDERLFDVARLGSKASRKAYEDGLRVIVGYRGAASAARAQVRDAGSTKVRRTLKALNAEALTTPSDDLPALWKSLTREDNGVTRDTATGVDRVWLDATVKARLDVSVPQIGADKVWEAGYDGTGVKVAVVDTGVDETHPDLAGRQIAEKNFSDSEDAKDRQGHGTHVASTVAGSGAKSGEKFKGVAPGAELIDAKVLGDTGSGDESGIISGIEWAVGQGADIVNMSLGGVDAPGVDPLEEAVDHYTESDGVLFAVAAGNEGPGASTIGTPGSADSALTVGAVDGDDRMADFSSRGPRIGDGAIKPDVTAPGVDITAASAPGSAIAEEYGEDPEGYVTISGTSMATPHVAGSAALLKQQHPDWTAAQLKGVLTASAKDTGFSAFEQGSGRVQADRATGASVYAEEASLNFGTAAWPHEDDEPIDRTLTYRNAGDTDVTLTLTAGGTGPGGEPAPDGMFAVSPAEVTVPAGKTAEVTVTADTAVEAPDGRYSGAVVARAGEQQVRSAFTVEREVASYEVELAHLGRDGKAAAQFQTYVTGLTGEAAGTEFALDESSESGTLRLPVGEYSVQGVVLADRADSTKGTDWIARPKLAVDKDQKVTLDARTAKPVDITVPDRRAKAAQAYMIYGIEAGGSSHRTGWQLTTYDNVRSAHLGPKIDDGSLQQLWDADFTVGDDTQYSLVYGGPVERLADGFERHEKRRGLAKVTAGVGETAPGKDAWLSTIGTLEGSLMGYASGRMPLDAPSTQHLYVSTADKARWSLAMEQLGDELPNGWRLTDSRHGVSFAEYRPGRTYREDFNTGVFGPVLDPEGGKGVVRSQNTLYAFISTFTDGQGHEGMVPEEAGSTRLTQDGEVIAENEQTVANQSFTVPAGEHEYTLSSTTTRDAKVARVGTRIDTSWTFRSKDGDTDAPVSTVRFSPDLDLRSTVKAGKRISVPVQVQGAAAGKNLKSLAVQASYDDGESWQKLRVRNGKVALRAPGKGEGVALRAEIVDRQGNRSEIAVYEAFLGR